MDKGKYYFYANTAKEILSKIRGNNDSVRISVDMNKSARGTPGVTGSDLANLIN